MLKKLKVRNLAVIESAEIDFSPGFNAITGETGAGKSVLMGALSLVLGARADAQVVRDGAKEAEVEAEFDGCTVRRTVSSSGKSRAWVDEESVTISELRDLGERFVDFHGPNANRSLLLETFQREALDTYASVDLSVYAAYFREHACLKDRIARLEADGGDEDEIDLLRYQTEELSSACICPDDDTLGERHAAAAHAEENIAAAASVTEALGGEGGAEYFLAAARRTVSAMVRKLPEAADWTERLDEIAGRLQDLSLSVAEKAAELAEQGEESLAELDARLSLIDRLKRKYIKTHGPVDSVSAALSEVLESKKRRLDEIENASGVLEQLRVDARAAEERLLAEGALVSARRKEAAPGLSEEVTRQLGELGFRKADFGISVLPSTAREHGCDEVAYFLRSNPGSAPRPLADIASSGEIARVMLALKTTLYSAASSRTLVFDEVDANVGGETARAVGEKLLAVSRSGQVIAITHLPQSAVFADRHIAVRKSLAGGTARTSVAAVEGEERVDEIARMLGGENLTSVARKHASELVLLRDRNRK